MVDLAVEINQAGGSARYLALDVSDRCATQQFISSAHAWFGRLDVVINNVGGMPFSKLEALKVGE